MIYPKDPMMHVQAGNLLMTTGAYIDAAKAYSNANEVVPSKEAYFHRARCHAALSML